jgi:BioD-like phosphotransacetylase family protein
MPPTTAERDAALRSALRHLAKATTDLAFAESLALSAQALDLARDVAAEHRELVRVRQWLRAKGA